MAWVVTPPTQTQPPGAGWVSSPTVKPIPPQSGWYGLQAVLQFDLGRPTGSGLLTITTMARPFAAALLAGDGALFTALLKREFRSAALVGDGEVRGDYHQILPATPEFSGEGQVFITLASTTVYPQFAGEGSLFPFRDGLSATVDIGIFGGSGSLGGYLDGLTATVVPGQSVDASFSGEGNLQILFGTIQFVLSQFAGQGTLSSALTPKLMADLAGSGALSAAAFELYVRTAALLGSGALSATTLIRFLQSIGFTGAGQLAALFVQMLSAAPGGVGTVTALTSQIYTIAMSSVSDYFDRPDSTTSPGPGWTNRFNAIGVLGNTAYPAVPGGWNVASNNTPMATEDVEVSMVMGPRTGTAEATFMILGANETGQCVFGYPYGGDTFYIFTETDWQFGGLVQQVGLSGSYTTGDTISFRRTSNVYQLRKNGVDIPGAVWPDTTNLVPRDLNHRLVGLACWEGGSYRRVGSFNAISLNALTGSGVLSAPVMRRVPGGDIEQLGNVVYTQSSVWTDGGANALAAADYPGMNNGTAVQGLKTGTFNDATAFVQADYLVSTYIDHIVVGYDHSNSLLPAGGWGVTYTEGALVRGSNDGSSWTTITTVSTYASTGSVNGLTSLAINGSWRYLRLEKSADWLAVTEFQLHGVPARLFTGSGTLAASAIGIIPVPRSPAFSGDGSLSATATRLFTPTTEENTARTNQAVPAGTFGAWVTLIGAGAGGGAGMTGTFTNKGGGGGGGGAAKIERVFVARSLLGSTYTVARPLGGGPQAAGAAATFVSGSVNLSAGGGGAGGNGTNNAGGTAGAAGVGSASGVAATIRNGTAGSTGGSQSGGSSAAAVDNTTGGAPGGSGGGGISSVAVKGGSGKGGNSATVAGGAGQSSTGGSGAAGTNAAAGNAGGGASGGGHSGTDNNASAGARGGNYGAGAGGSSGGDSGATAGTGGDSYTLIEWV